MAIMVGVAARKHRYCCCGMPAFILHIVLHSTALLLAVIGLALGAQSCNLNTRGQRIIIFRCLCQALGGTPEEEIKNLLLFRLSILL